MYIVLSSFVYGVQCVCLCIRSSMHFFTSTLVLKHIKLSMAPTRRLSFWRCCKHILSWCVPLSGLSGQIRSVSSVWPCLARRTALDCSSNWGTTCCRHLLIDDCMSEWTDEPTDEWMNDYMKERMSEWTNKRVNEWLKNWKIEHWKKWMNKQTGKWMFQMND